MTEPRGIVLSVESSCDETGIAVIRDGRTILSNVVASQTALHAASGGIVPEVAARAHLRWIVPVLDQALADANVTVEGVDAIAVTHGTGSCRLPARRAQFREDAGLGARQAVGRGQSPRGPSLCGLAPRRRASDRPEPVFPLVALIVSGGHTFLVEMPDHLTYRLLGQTVDDAAGEAFDKVGRLLGLAYPGGPAISRAADGAARHDAAFPRAWLGESYDFSFSGLKTAARRTIDAARVDEGLPTGRAADAEPDARLSDAATAELAWGFQDSVVDVLVTKTIRAAEQTGARSIVLGGGVAANAALRTRLGGEAAAIGLPLIVPRPALCTDNGAMIGAAGARRFAAGERADLSLDARPSLPLARR